jgi:hypothetical protein
VFTSTQPDLQPKELIHRSLITMWAMCGDFISKQYSGTHSVLTEVTKKGYQNIFDKIDHKTISVKRLVKQSITDDFKQECI